MNRPQFRWNTAAKAALKEGKRPRKEAPTWGSWVHVYWTAEEKKVRLACDVCTNATAAMAHNLELAREAKVVKAPEPAGATWDEVWASFLAARQSAPGLAGLQSAGRLWFAPVLNGKPARSITPADCMEVLLRAERGGLASSSRRYLYQFGKAALHHAMNVLEVCERNPWKKVVPPKVPKVRRPALSVEQAGNLLAGAGEHRLLLLFAVMTGCRRGEIAGLKWSDFQWDEGEGGVVYVARSWDRATTKGKETRAVPLHPVLREGLLAARSASMSEFVFPSPTTGGMRSRTWHAADLLRLVAERAGVELPPSVTFHSLRRTFATLVHEASKDKVAVQRLLGHSDPRMTDVYLAHSLGQLERAVAQFPLFQSVPAPAPDDAPSPPAKMQFAN